MRIEDQLVDGIRLAIREERLVLPTLPAVAIHISETAGHESVTAAALASEIAEDPALAARLLRVANSAAYRRTESVDNLQLAVTRLGLLTTRHLVVGLAINQVYESSSPQIAQRLNKVHDRSISVAAAAQVLARRYTDVKPELALLGGLIHEIGALPILRMAEAQPELAENSAALDGAVAEFAGPIGKMIVQAWAMPKELLDVPIGSRKILRDRPGPPDCTDVVIVARLHLTEATGKTPPKFDPERIPAFRKLRLNPRIRLIEQRGFAQEVAEAQAALSGA